MKLIKVNSTSNVLGCFYFSSRFAASSTRLFRIISISFISFISIMEREKST